MARARLETVLLTLAVATSLVACTRMLDFDSFSFEDAGVGGGGGAGGGDPDGGMDGGPGNCGDGVVDDDEECEDSRPEVNVSCESCMLVCTSGYADCNDDLHDSSGDGCESSLDATETCGGCDTSCSGDEICFARSCETPTKYGFPDDVQETAPLGGGYVMAFRVTLADATTAIGLGLVPAAAGTSFVAGLYGETNSEPGTLLASATGTTQNAEQTLALDPPHPLSSGSYWVAFHFPADVNVRVSNTAQATMMFVQHSWGTPLPSSGTSWDSSTVSRPAFFVVGVP